MIVLGLLACSDPVRRPPADPCEARPDAVGASERVLLVSLDTTRVDHLGPWGGDGLSPAIDRLAGSAYRWSQARSHAPWTKPSLTTAMTSTLPDEHGVTQWNTPVDEARPTLVTALHDAGFTTEAYVSHVAMDPVRDNFDVGFDHYELSWKSQAEAEPHAEIETSTHLTDLSLAALERLSAAPDPFLLWVHYSDPHDSYLHHDELLHLGDGPASVYGEEVAWTDHQLDRLLAVAEADPGLAIVLFTDHGEELRDHGDLGHTHTLYDELLRVALLVRAPGLEPDACDDAVGLVDLAPTVLDLVGVQAPDGFRGRSLLSAPPPRAHFAETRREWNLRGLVRWPYKLVWDLEDERGEVYDLALDPLESEDLWKKSDLRNELLDELAAAYPEIGER